MSEISFANGPDGKIASQDTMIYVQGNKQKIERGSVATITDLDKNIIYIIDKDRRVYTEMPLQALSSAQPDITPDEITLTETGKTRVIANYPCNEYRAAAGNKLEHVTISACVSTSVPGAKEMSEFDHHLVMRLSGHKSEGSGGNSTAGLMLEKHSVVSFRIPNTSRGKAYQTASLLADSRINKIQRKPLSLETFKPPEGYSKLQNRSHRMAPPASPGAPDQALETIAPILPLSFSLINT